MICQNRVSFYCEITVIVLYWGNTSTRSIYTGLPSSVDINELVFVVFITKMVKRLVFELTKLFTCAR